MLIISTCIHPKTSLTLITHKTVIPRNPDFTLKRFSPRVSSCKFELIILAINVQVDTIIVFEENFHE